MIGPGEFVTYDPVRFGCLLCPAQFPTTAEVEQHYDVCPGNWPRKYPTMELPVPQPRQRGLAERQPFQGRLGDWRDKFDLGTRFEQGVVTATDWNLKRVMLNGGKKWIDIGRLIPL